MTPATTLHSLNSIFNIKTINHKDNSLVEIHYKDTPAKYSITIYNARRELTTIGLTQVFLDRNYQLVLQIILSDWKSENL